MMSNADLIWRLVELLVKKDEYISQVALEQTKTVETPNDQKHNET